MKILLYNIAYGTGNPHGELRRLWQGHHYLLAPERPWRKITRFVQAASPDVIALIETDLGSFRTALAGENLIHHFPSGVNQPETLAQNGLYHAHYAGKYAPDSWLLHLPYWKYQGNALLSRSLPENTGGSFMPCGTKKLVLSARINGIFFAVVHLALTSKVRQKQLNFLAEFLPQNEPIILAGDFNTFGGAAEIGQFMQRTKLYNPNWRHRGTYPAWKPCKELDYILLSRNLTVKDFEVSHVPFSDHLPVLVEI